MPAISALRRNSSNLLGVKFNTLLSQSTGWQKHNSYRTRLGKTVLFDPCVPHVEWNFICYNNYYFPVNILNHWLEDPENAQFEKKSIPHSWKIIGNSEGGGGLSLASTVYKKKINMQLFWYFLCADPKTFCGEIMTIFWNCTMLHGGIFKIVKPLFLCFYFFSNLAVFQPIDWARNRSYKSEIWHISSTVVLGPKQCGILEFHFSLQMIGSNV